MRSAQSSSHKVQWGAAGLLAKVVLVALLIYAGVTLYHLQAQLQTAQAQESALSAQVQALEDENGALRADIAAADEEEKLEDVARSELGMVESGEKVFYESAY